MERTIEIQRLKPLLPNAGLNGLPKAAMFLSGGGSNAEEILRRLSVEAKPAFQVACLVTDAPATSRAKELGELYHLPVVAEDIREFYHARGETRVSIATPRGQEIREEWTNVLREKLAPYAVSFGIFAGFVPLTNLTADLPCLNVHPGDLTYRKDGQRYLVGLHEIPVERAILDGLDWLRSSVILATPVTGKGDDMDGGPLLGISRPMEMVISEEKLAEFKAIAAARPERRPVGGFKDDLEAFASARQGDLKEAGDWVVFYPVVKDFADDRYYVDSKDGRLYFRQGNGNFLPIETVQYGKDGSRELMLAGEGVR